jgi:voltage-gated potassium channel
VHTLTFPGQVFTSIYIISNIGIFAYTIAAFSKFVVNGEIFKSMHIRMIHKKISELNEHVIICGFGRYGSQIAKNFFKHQIDFVVIESNHDKIENIQNSPDKILYIEGDATHDNILIKAGIKKCKALICAMDGDAENLFTVLTARQFRPNINIISRVKDHTSEKKLIFAGADHIIMPEQIGGFYIANLVNKPDTIEFFNFITEQTDSEIGFEELEFNKLPEHCKGKSIRELQIRKLTGANIIGHKTNDGEYVVNPDPDTKFGSGTSFIILGTRDQIINLKKYLNDYGKK